jgi:hypothetical protein
MMRWAGWWLMVGVLLLGGCEGLHRTNVSVRQNCESPNGPAFSPPAQPWDYSACYPDGGRIR